MKPSKLKTKWSNFKDELIVGDILLLHKRQGPIAKLIKKKSDSYWTHTALIFKDKSVIKYGSPLLIEAYDQIEIHRLKKYTSRFDEYDIGVKRFPGLDAKQRNEFVKSFMLNNIDVPYDYSRLIGFLFDNILGSISKSIYHKFQKKLTNTEAFICSTFVHKAFHRFQEYEEIGGEFSNEEHKQLKKEELVTPGMIAEDDNFKWLFNERY